eukprot:gene5026-biopygen6629
MSRSRRPGGVPRRGAPPPPPPRGAAAAAPPRLRRGGRRARRRLRASVAKRARSLSGTVAAAQQWRCGVAPGMPQGAGLQAATSGSERVPKCRNFVSGASPGGDPVEPSLELARREIQWNLAWN